jgi:hypothetical protein
MSRVATMRKQSFGSRIVRQGLIVGLLLWLSLVLLGCASQPSEADNEAAIQVVKNFVAAVEKRDPSAMLNVIEPTEWRREIAPELRSYIGYIQRIAFQNPQYSLIDNTGELAHVRLVSSMEFALEGAEPAKQDVDLTFELVKLDGTWYLRTFDLPSANLPAN